MHKTIKKNHPKSQTHTNIIRTREQLHKSFQVNPFIYRNIKNHEAICCDLDREHTLYCDISNKTFKLKSRNKHFKSLCHKEYEKLIQINHTIQNPLFFNIDKKYDDYITNHNKKFEIY